MVRMLLISFGIVLLINAALVLPKLRQSLRDMKHETKSLEFN